MQVFKVHFSLDAKTHSKLWKNVRGALLIPSICHSPTLIKTHRVFNVKVSAGKMPFIAKVQAIVKWSA